MCVQHLVKDQRVLKLVQRLAAEEEGEGGGGEKGGSHISDDWEELTAYVSRGSTVCAATLLYVCRLIPFYIYGTVSLSEYVHMLYVCMV